MNIDTKLQEYVVNIRRELHECPELSLNEFKTKEKIVRELEKMGLVPFFSEKYPTAVYAEIKGEKGGKTVALRADTDALPIEEETDVAFKSKNTGVMHACGHDAHTAMLLGCAKYLTENRDKIKGKVKLIFEPAEEIGAAGRGIVAEGLLDDADTVFAIHIDPNIEAGKANIAPGIRMAGAGGFSAKIKGMGGHASNPSGGIDAIVASGAVIMGLQSIVSREISPLDSAVVSIGTINGGTKSNIICEEVEMKGSLRYYNNAVKELLPNSVKRIISDIASAYRCTAEVSASCMLPPCVNDRRCADIALKALEKAAGKDALNELPCFTGSDDFAFYLEKVPGVYAFLGVMPEGETVYPIHNKLFKLNEKGLGMGAMLYAEYALTYMEENI